MEIKDLLNEPVLYLILAAAFLCVILPWLKTKAEKTPNVVDDKIITLLELWATAAATRLMRLFK